VVVRGEAQAALTGDPGEIVSAPLRLLTVITRPTIAVAIHSTGAVRQARSG